LIKEMIAPGRLYLIPAPVSENTQDWVIPEMVRKELKGIGHFLVEDIRTARRYLSSLKVYESIEPLQFVVLNKNSKESEVKAMLNPILEGKNIGVISESGCPGVADPGSLAVNYAHRNNIPVVPLVGPSSILLALMASGMNGQRFAFQGYLPVNKNDASESIKLFEKESQGKNQTQIFIETPYRNNQVMANLIKTLHPETLLCVALDVTGSKEFIHTYPVSDWRRKPVELPKLPAIFLFLAG
jgi:16S rRNA (cytidine1402-2'-O)-methyltransferase